MKCESASFGKGFELGTTQPWVWKLRRYFWPGIGTQKVSFSSTGAWGRFPLSFLTFSVCSFSFFFLFFFLFFFFLCFFFLFVSCFYSVLVLIKVISRDWAPFNLGCMRKKVLLNQVTPEYFGQTEERVTLVVVNIAKWRWSVTTVFRRRCKGRPPQNSCAKCGHAN